MGNTTTYPIIEKDTEQGSGDFKDGKTIKYGVSRMQGYRRTMEDADVQSFGVADYDTNIALFGVFDGHGGMGGARCSKYVADNMIRVITARMKKGREDSRKSILSRMSSPATGSKGDKTTGGKKHELQEAMVDAFIDMDEELRKLPENVATPVACCKLSLPRGFDHAGSTAEVLFLTPTEYVIGNLGDSRIAICRNGALAFATVDHKPHDDGELARIKRAGGYVSDNRVNGDLAVSRTFGDFHFKDNPNLGPHEQLVSIIPWVTILDRHVDDEFIIVACDGVWDELTSAEAISFVYDLLIKQALSPHKVAEQLIDEALRRGSTDNLSCIIIQLKEGASASEGKRSVNGLRLALEVQKIRRHSQHDSISFVNPPIDEKKRQKEIRARKKAKKRAQRTPEIKSNLMDTEEDSKDDDASNGDMLSGDEGSLQPMSDDEMYAASADDENDDNDVSNDDVSKVDDVSKGTKKKKKKKKKKKTVSKEEQ